MRVAFESWINISDSHVAEDVPPHQLLRILKRAVFDELGIEPAVGTEVNVFEKDSIHCGLHWSAQFLCIHHILMLRIGSNRQHQCCEQCENLDIFHRIGAISNLY